MSWLWWMMTKQITSVMQQNRETVMLRSKDLVQTWRTEKAGQSQTNLVKVDDHGAVAHLWRFMVCVAGGRKCHTPCSWAHRHAQRVAWWLSSGIGVAHNQTLSLQCDWLGFILAKDTRGLQKDPKQDCDQERARRKAGQGWEGHTGHRSRYHVGVEGVSEFWSQSSLCARCFRNVFGAQATTEIMKD